MYETASRYGIMAQKTSKKARRIHLDLPYVIEQDPEAVLRKCKQMTTNEEYFANKKSNFETLRQKYESPLPDKEPPAKPIRREHDNAPSRLKKARGEIREIETFRDDEDHDGASDDDDYRDHHDDATGKKSHSEASSSKLTERCPKREKMTESRQMKKAALRDEDDNDSMEPSPKKNCTLASRMTSAHEHVTTPPTKRPRLAEALQIEEHAATERNSMQPAPQPKLGPSSPTENILPLTPQDEAHAETPTNTARENAAATPEAQTPRRKPANWAAMSPNQKKNWEKEPKRLAETSIQI